MTDWRTVPKYNSSQPRHADRTRRSYKTMLFLHTGPQSEHKPTSSDGFPNPDNYQQSQHSHQRPCMEVCHRSREPLHRQAKRFCEVKEAKTWPWLRTDSRLPLRSPGRAFCQKSILSGNSALATLNASGAMWTCWKPRSSVRWTRGKGMKLL